MGISIRSPFYGGSTLPPPPINNNKKQKRMKSIKEKAEEHGRNWYHRERNLSSRCDGCYAHVISSYEAGASYVINEIEEIINHPRRFVTDNKTIEEGMIEEISKLIEHLKEK